MGRLIDKRKPNIVCLRDLKIGEAFQLGDSIGIISELTPGLKSLLLKKSSPDEYVAVFNYANCTLELHNPSTEITRISDYELHLV